MVREFRRLEVPHERAQALTLVRAVEETDRRGLLLPHDVRRQATEAARGRNEDDGWLAIRAERLVSELRERWSFLPRLLRFTNPGLRLGLPTSVLALATGLATNALGPERQIHVLALPLAGILAWNLAMLLLLGIRRWLPIGRSAWKDKPRLLDLLEAWSRRWLDRLPRDAAADPDLVRTALASYLREWSPTVAPLAAARLRRILHTAALMLLAGAVAGMYVRGVVFAYRATWESTFLGPEAVQSVAEILLGPASAVSGIDIPEAAASEGPAGRAAAGADAAPWIHLWAATAAIFVGLPRVLLIVLEGLKVARMSRRLPVRLPEAYLRRLLSAVSQDPHRIEVQPYSYRLKPRASDTLRARLLDVYGARSQVRIHSPVDYGAEPSELDFTAGRCWLAVFNLAQTPEVEVHGAFLAAVLESLPDGQVFRAVVDSSVFRERSPPGDAGKKRREERQRTWDRVVAEAGLEAVHVDLSSDDADAIVAALASDPG